MWKTSWQRKRFLSEILRLWKKRGLGIAVILGHLMHSNGGPFTTSFYLNGPKSRGRKQLNNKLQICFHSTTSFNQFYFSVVTNHVSSLPKTFKLSNWKNQIQKYHTDAACSWNCHKKSNSFLHKVSCSLSSPVQSSIFEETCQMFKVIWWWWWWWWFRRERGDGQWMFMGNVRVVDNWKAIFTPIPLFFNYFSSLSLS